MKSGNEVPESPFLVVVEAAEPENAVGSPCDFLLENPGLNLPNDLPKLTSTLRRPGLSAEEPIKLRVLSDNSLVASFLPKSTGEHFISVKKRNRHVPGSPFSIIVTASEPTTCVGKPANVGLGNIPVEDLPRLEAGLQRPGSKVEKPVKIKPNSDDTLSASFIPHEGGVHRLNVRKDKKPLPDSPYLVDVPKKEGREVGPAKEAGEVKEDGPVKKPGQVKEDGLVRKPGQVKEDGPVKKPGLVKQVVPVQEISPLDEISPLEGGRTPEVRPVGQTYDVALDIPGIVLPGDLKKLRATLERPDSNREEPVTLELNRDNTLGKNVFVEISVLA